jgi:hypothetical protein
MKTPWQKLNSMSKAKADKYCDEVVISQSSGIFSNIAEMLAEA